jgi:hypothetical protein
MPRASRACRSDENDPLRSLAGSKSRSAAALRGGETREPPGVKAPAARLSSSRVDWPAQPLSRSGTESFQSYFMDCFNCASFPPICWSSRQLGSSSSSISRPPMRQADCPIFRGKRTCTRLYRAAAAFVHRCFVVTLQQLLSLFALTTILHLILTPMGVQNAAVQDTGKFMRVFCTTATSAALLALSITANAAEVGAEAPAYVPPAPVPAPFSWTGLYSGLHLGGASGGGAWGQNALTDSLFNQGFSSNGGRRS